MALTYDLFIGSNNATQRVEAELVETILLRHFDGYTITLATGVWLGVREESLVVTIHDQRADAAHHRERVLRELCETLEQDAVAYRETSPLTFYSLTV